MTAADGTPERIWLDWEVSNASYHAFDEPPTSEFQDAQTEWVRADLYAALEARIATLTAALAEREAT